MIPKYTSGIVDDISWFEFRSDFQSPVTRIEWQTGSAMILLPQDQAKAMVRAGYADGISDKLLDQYNVAADKWNASAAKEAAEEAKAAFAAAEEAKAAAKAAAPPLHVQPQAKPLNQPPAPPPAPAKGEPVDNAK